MGVKSKQELVSAAVRGDPAAFAELVAPVRGRVVAVVARLVGSDEAEDVVQEALLRAYLGLSRLREPERFESWLCGVAINVAKMRLRSTAIRARAVPAAPRPLVVEEEEEVLDLVRDAVGLLPAGQRDVVLMHYVDDLSCEEIARLLGTSAGAVRVRLHRARMQLRRELAPHAPAPFAARAKELPLVDMKVEDVVVRVTAGDAGIVQHAAAIILRETNGDRSLPIFVGMPEATSLAVPLANDTFPRPATADVAIELLRAAGGAIERIAITEVREKVLYAVISVNGTDVDARPSDAINLAVRGGAPILVEESVLDELGVSGTSTVVETVERAAAALGLGVPPGEWRPLSMELLRALLPALATPPGR